MAYSIRNVHGVRLLELLIALKVIPDFDQYILAKSGIRRVTFIGDKIE